MTTTGEADWRALLAEVPREPFLPEIIWTDGPGRTFVPVSRSAEPARWAELTEGDQPVITQVDDGELDPGLPGVLPSSSASQPSIVAAMLDAAEVHPGAAVLEIGTGTGWNAAMLARRVGPSGRVVSVEIDRQVAEHARHALAAAEAEAEVIIGDGEDGWPPGAPYDRVLATVAAREIPRAWIEQTRPGGLVVAPWGTDYSTGTLLRLRVQPDGIATGDLREGFAFMRLRGQRRYAVNPAGTELDASTAEHSLAEVDGTDVYRMITTGEAGFTIGLRVPDCRLLVEQDARGERHHVVELHDLTTGSWALLDVDLTTRDDGFDVHQHGPRRLWAEVLAGYRWWQDHGRPELARFGVTITPQAQTVWLDRPDGEHCWTVG